MCGQPKPTSSDIITTKPRMEVHEASFPLPLMKKRKITGKKKNKNSGLRGFVFLLLGVWVTKTMPLRTTAPFLCQSLMFLFLTWLEPLVWCHPPPHTPLPQRRTPAHMAREVLPRQRQRLPATQRGAPPSHSAGRTWCRFKITVDSRKWCTIYHNVNFRQQLSLTRRLSTQRPRPLGVANSLLGLLGNSGFQYQWLNFWMMKKEKSFMSIFRKYYNHPNIINPMMCQEFFFQPI